MSFWVALGFPMIAAVFAADVELQCVIVDAAEVA